MRYYACLLWAVLLGGCTAGRVDGPIPADPREDEVKLVDRWMGPYRIVVHQLGLPPRLVGLCRVKGNLSVRVFVKSNPLVPIFQEMSWEYYPGFIVDYAELADGRVVITDCAYDVRVSCEDPVPFIETTVALSPDGKYRSKRKVVMAGEDADDAEIARLAEEVRRVATRPSAEMEGETEADLLEVPLARLRSIGIVRPAEVLKVLDRLCRDLAHLVSPAAVIGDYHAEVHEARDVRLHPRAGKPR